MQWIQEALKQETITVKKQLNQGLKELDKSQKAEKKKLYKIKKASELLHFNYQNLPKEKQDKIKLIKNKYPKLYRMYSFKDDFSALLKQKFSSLEDSQKKLKRIIYRASHHIFQSVKNFGKNRQAFHFYSSLTFNQY